MKFAVLSHVLPPSPSGQAVMLYRILSGIDQDQYYLINTRDNLKSSNSSMNDQFLLPGVCYSLRPEPILNRAYGFGLSWIIKVINVFIKFYVRTGNILSILRHETNTNAIVVCTGDFVDMPAGFLVSRIRGIPFYAYIFDDYAHQFTGSERWVAKLIAPFIFKHSAGIIGPNEFICQEYQSRYGVDTVLVRNPCDKTELEKKSLIQTSKPKDKIKIVYTGDIYLANFACFRNLIQAMDLLQQYPLELHIFTSRLPSQLKAEGIESNKTFIHPHLPYREVLNQQQMSDILFLPLAFDSPFQELIRTSSPGKLGEYLASGRPVLAHVPANSFVAHYLKKNKCGLVASENDPLSLRNHILHLIHDQEFCQAIIQRARQMAMLDFDPQVAGRSLVNYLANGLYGTSV